MRTARRSRAAWLRFRAPPVDRQHPVAPSRNPVPASARPVDRPARPGSPPHRRIGAQTGLRAAIDPPAYPESAAWRGPVARSARLRPVRAALSPPVGRPSALGRVRFGPQPGAGWSMSPPLRTAGSRLGSLSAACADPSGTPGTPTPAPRSVPGRATTGWDTYARACGVEIFRKKNPREGDRPAPPLSSLGRRARRGHRFPCQRVCFPEAGWRRGSCGPWLLGHVRRS